MKLFINLAIIFVFVISAAVALNFSLGVQPHNSNPTTKTFKIDYDKIETFEQTKTDRIWWVTKTTCKNAYDKIEERSKKVYNKLEVFVQTKTDQISRTTKNIFESVNDKTNQIWCSTENTCKNVYNKIKSTFKKVE